MKPATCHEASNPHTQAAYGVCSTPAPGAPSCAQAQAWLALGEVQAQRAQQEVEAVLPLLSAHGSLEARSRGLVALAEIMLAKHHSAAGVATEAER